MLPEPEMNRRGFARLASAALSGLLVGSAVAQEKKDPKKEPKKNPLLSDKHVCKGLNACKGKGKGGKNDCAGIGACATAKAHTCGEMNECRGQGGCGQSPARTSAKAWARATFPWKRKPGTRLASASKS